MFTVRVPATSANIGPCFDTAGLALTLYNETEVFDKNDIEANPRPLIEVNCIIEESIRANQIIPDDETNLVWQTVNLFCEKVGVPVPFFAIRQTDAIPLTRGLGSSAACVVAGLMIANELTKSGIPKDELINMSVEIEGHPDNVAPAFLGGMVVGASDGKRFEHVRIDVSDELEFFAVIPDFPLSTEDARAVLPRAYTKEQAVFNCSRVALLVSAMMSGNFGALSVAMQDEIHQPYRKILIPGMESIIRHSVEFGAYGAYLSGAGPTIMVVAPKGSDIKPRLEKLVSEFNHFWFVLPLGVDKNGAEVIK
ncbi:MAG: homoserine kinase [Clostridia bacterium]|nr:homoserine kinase [Clostridia bacterium]